MKYKTPKRNRIKQRSKSEKIVFTIAFVILAFIAATYIFAFIWGALAGLKTHEELVLEPWKLPKTWQFKNYIDAFEMLEIDTGTKNVNMMGMIVNSLWLVVGGSVFSIFASTFMAYAVTKYKFPGRNLLIAINIITMTLPIIGAMPARYRLFSSLGLINSPKILIAYTGGFGSFNLYMCAFFRGVSPTYYEAAEIDGANAYVIMFKIIMPLAKGILIALFIMQGVAIWNDYDTALVYMPKLPTLATGIYLFNREMTYRVRMDILMAATILSAIPPLVLYLIGHKAILDNVSLGGIKG